MTIASQPSKDAVPARRAAAWLVWWALLMSLWLLLVDSISMPELLAGAGAAVIAATLVELAEFQAGVRLVLRPEWIAGARTLPVEALRDTVVVLRAAVAVLAGRRPASSFRVVPVDLGGDDPAAATHRLLVTAGWSLAPNAIVVGIDPERGEALLHRLVPPAQPRPGERVVSGR